MRAIGIAGSVLAALALSSCEEPNASGIYLSSSERQVTLVQLVEAKDGKLSGRLEEVRIGGDGAVSDQSTNLDGIASKQDLMFKPASAWFGGLAASGRFNGDDLTLTGTGFTLQAERSSLEKYQAAVAHLQSVAAADRQRIATAQAAQAAQAAKVQAQQAQEKSIGIAADRASRIEAAAYALGGETGRLNAALTAAPDFGLRAASNTARIAQILKAAATSSPNGRNQLAVEANQVIVATNQIEVARTQYANELNQIVQRAGPVAVELQRFCGSPEASQFARPCERAKIAVADFQGSLVKGQKSFNGFKRSVQSELSRQEVT
jgi:hypothetical protein